MLPKGDRLFRINCVVLPKLAVGSKFGGFLTIEEAFGLVIRRLRRERSLSQEQLSLSSTLGRAFISQLERGKQQPTLLTIFGLASALCVQPARILTEIELLLGFNDALQCRHDLQIVYDGWCCSQEELMQNHFEELRGNETILLVDDESQLREMLSDLLTEYGYTVLVAEDGQDAVHVYKNSRERIQLILMDVIMPRKDGIKACREILDLNQHALVVLMSAYSTESLNCIKQTSFIQKPMTPLELLKKIRYTLNDSPNTCQHASGAIN